MSETIQTNHRGYLGGEVGDPILKRSGAEYQKYETGYFQSGFHVGYDHLLFDPEPAWVGEGSLRLQADYYYVGGNEGNLGSNKYQYGFLTGFKQRLIPFPFSSWNGVRLFVDPMLGVGIADNHLNFGRGFPLEQETSFNGLVRLSGGAEYCFYGNACLALKGGYELERSLIGVNYFQRGWQVGPVLEIPLSGLADGSVDGCWQELNKVRGYVANCEDIRRNSYEKEAALHGQIKDALAVNYKLKQMMLQQIGAYQKECGDPQISLEEKATSLSELKPLSHWIWEVAECSMQLQKAREALQQCFLKDPQELDAAQLTAMLQQIRQNQNEWVDRSNAVFRWVFECRRAAIFRTPQALFLFPNDGADMALQPQRFFDRSMGRVNPDLDDWVIYLNRPENKNIKVRIHGYANDTGDPEYNLSLSQKRVANFHRYLTTAEREKKTPYGPTLVPIEQVPQEQRTGKNCVHGKKQTEATPIYCPVYLDPVRVESAVGHGSGSAEVERLKERLKQFGLVVTEADPQHPVYRMVWLEISDREGNFQ